MRICAAVLVSLGLTLGLTGPLRAAELIMVEQHGCHWCEQWNAEIAPAYPHTEEGARAPLRRVLIRDLPEDVEFTSRPVFTPTFVLVHEGQELGRMEGYAGDEFFWFLLGQLLDAHPDATAPQ
jgi:thioredoxin-related protein